MDWIDEQIARYPRYSVGHNFTDVEKRLNYGFIPILAFPGSDRGDKGSVGDDDTFLLPAYRNLVRFINPALESYKLSTEV